MTDHISGIGMFFGISGECRLLLCQLDENEKEIEIIFDKTFYKYDFI